MTSTTVTAFCERCGTRTTPEPAATRGLPGLVDRVRTAVNGSTAADDGLRLCLGCRGYVCAACMNDAAGECLECSPLDVVATPTAGTRDGRAADPPLPAPAAVGAVEAAPAAVSEPGEIELPRVYLVEDQDEGSPPAPLLDVPPVPVDLVLSVPPPAPADLAPDLSAEEVVHLPAPRQPPVRRVHTPPVALPPPVAPAPAPSALPGTPPAWTSTPVTPGRRPKQPAPPATPPVVPLPSVVPPAAWAAESSAAPAAGPPAPTVGAMLMPAPSVLPSPAPRVLMPAEARARLAAWQASQPQPIARACHHCELPISSRASFCRRCGTAQPRVA